MWPRQWPTGRAQRWDARGPCTAWGFGSPGLHCTSPLCSGTETVCMFTQKQKHTFSLLSAQCLPAIVPAFFFALKYALKLRCICK